jgi:pimeloyl-ACP methyl ester carboxylesterase
MPSFWLSLRYSRLVSLLYTACIRLSPYYGRLTQLEADNLVNYWHSLGKLKHPVLRFLARGWALWVSYWAAVYRITTLGREARQDYYALLRLGGYAVKQLPSLVQQTWERRKDLIPVLIVPGLNTPAVFFREMASFLQRSGYRVAVITLPQKGLASLAQSSEWLAQEVDHYCQQWDVSKVHLIGHCMGGAIAKVMSEDERFSGIAQRVQSIISLGTGFLGADGVGLLKCYWMRNHPNQTAPVIFDELVQFNRNWVNQSASIMYHSVLTIWDMMVLFQKGFLTAATSAETTARKQVGNHLLTDPEIDHLTLVLHPKALQTIRGLLQGSELPVTA